MARTTILLLLTLCHASFLPEPYNHTDHTIGHLPVCKESSCINDWIQSNDPGAANCSQLSNYTELLIELFSTGKMRKDLIKRFTEYQKLRFCADTCTVENVVKMIWLLPAVQLEFARAYADDDVIRKDCVWWSFHYCRWWRHSTRFNFVFALFALPATIIINLVNMSTLTKLIGAHKTPAASLYFHKAEIATDVCCSIFFYLWNNFWLFYSVDRILHMCLPAVIPYINAYNFSTAVFSFLAFINQCTLYNLVADRCSALKDPLNYDTFNGQCNARKREIKTFVFSFILYTPLLSIYLFQPLFQFWKRQTDNEWTIICLNHFINVVRYLYALSPIACIIAQFIRGIQYQKLYEMQYKSRATSNNAEVENQISLDEKEKRILLCGTVGLNIVASSITTLLSVVDSHFVQDVIGPRWWYNILYILSSFFMFMNGSGSFMIHVILLKSYRDAFWGTVFGRAVGKVWRKLSRNWTI